VSVYGDVSVSALHWLGDGAPLWRAVVFTRVANFVASLVSPRNRVEISYVDFFPRFFMINSLVIPCEGDNRWLLAQSLGRCSLDKKLRSVGVSRSLLGSREVTPIFLTKVSLQISIVLKQRSGYILNEYARIDKNDMHLKFIYAHNGSISSRLSRLILFDNEKRIRSSCFSTHRVAARTPVDEPGDDCKRATSLKERLHNCRCPEG
jgi:hypothetical protein